MLIRSTTPDDTWPIAAVDVASWQAAYRGLMPDEYLNGLSIEQRTADWRRRLLGVDAQRGRRIYMADDTGVVTGFVRLGPDPDDLLSGFIVLLYVPPSASSKPTIAPAASTSASGGAPPESDRWITTAVGNWPYCATLSRWNR